MENRLCTNEFKQFYTTLQSEAVSLDDMLNLTANAMSYIADFLHLGKLEIAIEMPKSSSERAINIIRTLYEADEYDLYSHTRLIKARGGSHISYVAFPAKGCSWNTEAKDELDFIFKTITSSLTRAHVYALYTMKEMTDTLTGLPNTECFMKYANEPTIKCTLMQYTIVFSNLKNFNYINQQSGSRVGDIALKEYAKKLLEFKKDTGMIARFGGDNFVAILKNEDVSRYLDYISNIPISVASNNMVKIFDVAARSGVFLIPDKMPINDAISRANTSLTYAKYSSDKQYVYFKDELLERSVKEREISSYFKIALAKKEFIVYYQPKVDIDTRQISGCEALVRWMHDGKLVPPGHFIPVLENEGSVCELDFYVLDKVCQDINNWVKDGIIPACVSVNFSKLHLRNPNLAHDILRVVDSYHIDPKYIEIELTESSSYESFETLVKFINELNAYGIKTSIDDFGTGYSSLNLLKDLQISVIKIDKSFVDNITNDKSPDRIILKSILTMINELGMGVIAEGCETVEQARILRDMNCNTIQGYLFDKPLPLDEYTKKLENNYVYQIEV